MKTTLSRKKEQLLYSEVHESIMQARLKIWKMKDYKNISIAEIDDILYDLCIEAPIKALKCFEILETKLNQNR